MRGRAAAARPTGGARRGGRQVIAKTLSPAWGESFELEAGAGDGELRVVLYDSDAGLLYGSSKEYLGSVAVPLAPLAGRGAVEQWCEERGPLESLWRGEREGGREGERERERERGRERENQN